MSLIWFVFVFMKVVGFYVLSILYCTPLLNFCIVCCSFSSGSLKSLRETIMSSAKGFYIRVKAKPLGNGSRELGKAPATSQVPVWGCWEKDWWQAVSLEEKQLSVQAGGGAALGPESEFLWGRLRL